MTKHQPFNFRTCVELLEKVHELGIDLPFQESIDPLFQTIKIGSKTVPNRIAVLPMEGYDGNIDGSPSELTFHRYKRYAEGGSGLIWFEATSVMQEGRSNPRQLLLNQGSLDLTKRLVELTKRLAVRTFGAKHDPFLILQITHSGRFSRPEGEYLGKIACQNPYLDKQDIEYSLFNDEELERLGNVLVDAVGLACDAGFDAVDIKACHGYLIHALLGAHTRTNGRYGGSFDNRIRLLTDVVEQAHVEHPDVVIAVRLNATDNIPYPYGFGMAPDGSMEIDLSEPKQLIQRLIDNGCKLLNITIGNPYHSPHWVRPFDRPVPGDSIPEEHPLEGVFRFIQITRELQNQFPSTPFVLSGLSWLRHFWPHVGAAIIERNSATFIGLGRSSFAYPDAPSDLLENGQLDRKKACITCSKCTELIRHDRPTGCVVRDSEIYAKEYKKIEKIIPKNAQ